MFTESKTRYVAKTQNISCEELGEDIYVKRELNLGKPNFLLTRSPKYLLIVIFPPK